MSIPGDDFERECRGELPGLIGRESHIELAKHHLEAAQSLLEEVGCDAAVVDTVTEALDRLYAVKENK